MIPPCLFVPAALALFAAPTFAQGSDSEGCKDHAPCTRFPGFYIQRCTLKQ